MKKLFCESLVDFY